MFNRRDVIFLYDGSFYGLLTVIFVCYYTHTYPAGMFFLSEPDDEQDASYFAASVRIRSFSITSINSASLCFILIILYHTNIRLSNIFSIKFQFKHFLFIVKIQT